MKNGIVYGIIFLFAFVLVTGALFFLNSQYKNIFTFDFSPETHEQAKETKKTDGAVHVDSLKSDSTSVIKDSTSVVHDSTSVVKDSTKTPENLQQTKLAEAKPAQKKPAEPVAVTENPMLPKTNMKVSAKKDSIYNAWLKQTVQLYEAMDSKKVAKVILGYSDNIARDLILRMRKKKAAEVLSEFKPEVVTRLISVN